jgi:hypothetical protein
MNDLVVRRWVVFKPTDSGAVHIRTSKETKRVCLDQNKIK